MSNIKELLKGVEVEWKSLGEVCNVLRGKRLTKKDLLENGTYPVFHGGIIPLGLYDKYNRKANQTMIINTGSIGEVVWSGVDFWSSDGTFVIETNDTLEDKFLYHFLKIQESYFKSQKREGGVPTIDRIIVENLIIPIPPLHIQNEIVRILDNFTELTAELTAELRARKKQYSYYRDKLLTFEDGEVEFKPLGEIADVGVGSKPEIICETIQNFEYINAGTTNSGYTDTFNCDGDTVTTPSRGQGGIGFVGYQKNEFWLGPLCYKIRRKEDSDVITKYLYYFLEHNNYLILGLKKEGGVPAVNRGDLIKLNIPIPSLEEQQKIVATLDNFDTLINSISDGLPKEIELRTKQYEYYRDLFLTFSKKEVEA